MANVETKACGRCGATKPLSDFHRDRTKPDGRQIRCKECRRETRYVKLGVSPERPSWAEWWRKRILRNNYDNSGR